MQILGMVLPFVLIFEMGIMPLLFSFGLIAVGVTWYWMYARKKVVRTGAIYHLFERMGRLRYDGLDTELRGILKEKGLREADPFDEIVARSLVIDLENREAFEEVVTRSARWFSKLVDKSAEEIEKQFLEGTRMGATPVTHGIALPHIRLKHMQQAEMVIVRGRDGVHIKFKNPLTDFEEDEQDVNAVFFLVSPQEDPTQHLRILAQIAGRVEEDTFVVEWSNAKDEQEIKEALLHEDRLLSISIRKHTPSESLMNHSLKDVRFPEGCLVAILRRQGKTIIPKGNTVIKEGDRLTIIGEPKGMAELKQIYE
jgi:mannitol/fructose-specific phosphotransferase system IIA component (Ntr-type)